MADVDFERKIATYEGMVAVLGEFARRGSAGAVLPVVEEIAAFAETRHAGTFADGRLENPAYAIGRALRGDASAPRHVSEHGARGNGGSAGRRRVLHVGTDLPDIGGHTRIALNWIRNDRASVHSIAMTGRSLAAPMAEAAAASGGAVAFLEGSPQQKALQLRALARAVDLVVLHVSNRDVVPVMAFAADDLPRIGVLNHSDHLFWLGSSIADTVINLRSVGRTLSRERRLSRHDSLMSIPLTDPLQRLSRSSARQALGIPDSQLMLLSVGRSIKYKPDATHDFFRSAHAVLERHAEAHLYIVGVTPEDARGYSTFGAHERMHLCGPRSDATLFQVAADLYIESFPFGSQTACLEVCMCGVPPVLQHTPAGLVLTTNEDCITHLIGNPESEAEHIELVSGLIREPAYRRELGMEIRRRILAHHTGAGWIDGLEGVYAEMGRMTHSHEALPAEPCRRDPYDLALSAWLDAQAGGALQAAGEARDTVKRRVEELAYDHRARGAYGDAFWMLESHRRSAGLSVDLALSAGKLGPHWLLNVARRAVGTHRNA
jgi:hypothetical protein